MAFRDRITELRRVKASDLTPHPKNYRTHPSSQRSALSSVLEQVGFADALVVRETAEGLQIVDGHLRADVAADQEVPVLVVDVSDLEAELLLASLDPIAAMAKSDTDALMGMLDGLSGLRGADTAVAALIAGDAALRKMHAQRERDALIQDEVPNPPTEPITKPGDLWIMGEHRLLCGDATNAEDMARLMNGAQAEMVWTDPPYGVDIGGKNRFLNSIARSNRVEEPLENDQLDEPALLEMLRKALSGAASACLAGAAVFVAAPPGPLHLLTGQVLNDLGIWHQTIQWVKNNATFAPLGVDYHWRAEPIFFGWVPGAAHRYYGGRKQDTVWEIDRPTASPEHPTMKPVELVARAIQNHSLGGEIVLDPFMGSGTTLIAAERLASQAYGAEIAATYSEQFMDNGTTLIAAEQLGRRAYGLEIAPAYCDVVVHRWENLTGQTATRE